MYRGSSQMRVLYVTPEVYPLVKTGGLADVSAALPAALMKLGVDARVLVPGYPAVIRGLGELTPVGDRQISDLPGLASGRLLSGKLPSGVPVYVLDAPALFDRPGNPYLGSGGRDWPDNPIRFAALCWAAATFAWKSSPDPEWHPDVIHGHDWQAGLVPAYLEFLPERLGGRRRPATVITIHNIAYQGRFDRSLLAALRLPPRAYGVDGVEFWGAIGFLKAGCRLSDGVTTVSPTYSLEIQTPEYGMGMEGLLASRADDLRGILNGVDYGVWDPATDEALPARYSWEDMSGKAVCKADLQAAFKLDPKPEAPVACVVSRLSSHKGLDLVLEAASEWVKAGGQLAILGSGDEWTETGFRNLNAWFPGSVGVHIGYDEALSHRVQAGSDMILVPSRSEPCGLTQLYGLKYGTLPLVRRTGGLADTVIDATQAALTAGVATGFQFVNPTAQELTWALRRAMNLYYRDPKRWTVTQGNAMRASFEWDDPAAEYKALYRSLMR